MMRKGKTHHRSCSNAGTISEKGKYLHVTAPSTSLMVKSKVVIQKDYLQHCCVVLPPTADASKYLAEARELLGIQLDSDGATGNCKTFCQHVHGVWDKNFQSPTGGGQQMVNAFTKGSKLIKASLDESLAAQMRKKITNVSLILPNEKF